MSDAFRHTNVAQFRRSAFIAIDDVRLQSSLEGATRRLRDSRAVALAELPDAEGLRDHLKEIRDATIANLAEHLQTFADQAIAAGAQVHWARDATEACALVRDIARANGVKLVTKSKSMATEEIRLNAALAADGIEAVETDLGEWIIQLAQDPPSHIIVPAIHITRHKVAELFAAEAGRPLDADDIPVLTDTARHILRERFLAAGMGITGANIGVAETGSIVLVTNEGNADLVTGAPPIHVAVMGIEKVAPTWDEAAPWLALLGRSATGQPLSIYTTILTGPARDDEPDGPRELHIILLDNKRSQYIGTPYEEMLHCIRCGACLNACPVYRTAGGHAYGSPYSGPIGAVVSPLLFGHDQYEGLAQASSLCGACLEVCPVRIDIPRLLLELRREQVSTGLMPAPERLGEQVAARVLGHERLLRLLTTGLRLGQRPFLRRSPGGAGQTLSLPRPLHPAGDRALPALAPRPFRDLWAAGELEDVV